MRKFILFLILTIILLIFTTFFVKVYIEQKNYFNSKKSLVIIETSTPVVSNEAPSIYKNYSKEDYDMALSEKRITVLFFTSNWCSDCLVQEIVNNETFLSLKTEGLIGLQIHILDSETTIETDALAKKFGVTRESTFIILDKNGAINSKYTGSIAKELLFEKILKAKEIQ